MYAIRDIEEIKERLLSFGKYAENAAPDVLVTLIQTFVERIYITDENDERHCHIFIKGCSKEDYDDFFRATGYIENTQETGTVTSVLPVCDSEECCKTNIIKRPFKRPLQIHSFFLACNKDKGSFSVNIEQPSFAFSKNFSTGVSAPVQGSIPLERRYLQLSSASFPLFQKHA